MRLNVLNLSVILRYSHTPFFLCVIFPPVLPFEKIFCYQTTGIKTLSMAPSTPTGPRRTRGSASLPSSVRVRNNSHSDNRSTVSALTAGSPPFVFATMTATASASNATETTVQDDDPSLQAENEQFLSQELEGGDGSDGGDMRRETNWSFMIKHW